MSILFHGICTCYLHGETYNDGVIALNNMKLVLK